MKIKIKRIKGPNYKKQIKSGNYIFVFNNNVLYGVLTEHTGGFPNNYPKKYIIRGTKENKIVLSSNLDILLSIWETVLNFKYYKLIY